MPGVAQTVSGSLNVLYNSNCQTASTAVQVTNCGTFYVYYLFPFYYSYNFAFCAGTAVTS